MSHHLRPFGLIFSVYIGLGAVSNWAAEPRKAEQAWLPIAFLSPENGLGLGAKWIARQPLPTVNRFDVHAYVTTRAQFETKVNVRGAAYTVALEGYDTPYAYYGAGNHPSAADSGEGLPYETLGGKGLVEGLWRSPWQPLRLRGAASLQGVRMLSLGEGMTEAESEALLPRDMPGRAGGWHDLYEAALEWDTRNDEDLPTRGVFASARFGHSAPWADFDFGKGEAFVAAYAQPHGAFEWAGKAVHRATLGPAPFYERPVLGDRKNARGIPDRRLRDRQAQALQTEFRYTFHLALPLIARAFGDTWQVATFGELSRVGGDFATMMRESWHPSGGVGGRLIVHHRLGALRGDLGFSEYGFGLYVDFNQAF